MPDQPPLAHPDPPLTDGVVQVTCPEPKPPRPVAPPPGLTIEHMTIQRMDHVGIVVDDLAAAIVAGLRARGAELVGELER
jgi:hypothetical protein